MNTTETNNVQTALQRIYDALPAVQCRGKCQDNCSSIAFFPAEVAHVHSRGLKLPTVTDILPDRAHCTALDQTTGRCSIYEARPLICRVYGASKGLRCEHGCRPKRWLSTAEVRAITAEIKALLGGETYFNHPMGADLPALLNELSARGLTPEGGWR